MHILFVVNLVIESMKMKVGDSVLRKKFIWRLELKKVGLEQVENTVGDSFELYYGLFMYNPNATEEVKLLHSSQGYW